MFRVLLIAALTVFCCSASEGYNNQTTTLQPTTTITTPLPATTTPQPTNTAPPKKRTKIRVISDTHIGSTWFTNESSHNDLMKVLRMTAAPQSGIDTLVLLGDIVELWMDPVAQKPGFLRSKFQGVRNKFEMMQFVQEHQRQGGPRHRRDSR